MTIEKLANPIHPRRLPFLKLVCVFDFILATWAWAHGLGETPLGALVIPQALYWAATGTVVLWIQPQYALEEYEQSHQ